MVRVSDGVISQTRLPRRGRLSDGRSVSNFHALPAETLHAEGWREVKDNGEPDYDPETQRVRRSLEVHGDEVRAAYTVEDRPPPEDAGPTAGDVLDAIRELAGEGAEVEKRIHERATQRAQERAQAVR